MKVLKLHLMITMLLVSFSLCYGSTKQSSFFDLKENDLLRIEYVGTSTGKVRIGGYLYSRGDKFLATKTVSLNEKEYIKVTNTRTGASLSVCGKDLRRRKTNTIFEFVKKTDMAVKGQSDFDTKRKYFGAMLGRYKWSMIDDTIIIPAPTIFKLDKHCAFTITKFPEGKILPVPYNDVVNNDYTQDLVLTKNYLQKHLDQELKYGYDYRFIVEYWVGDTLRYNITDNFIIQYVPIIKHEN